MVKRQSQGRVAQRRSVATERNPLEAEARASQKPVTSTTGQEKLPEGNSHHHPNFSEL